MIKPDRVGQIDQILDRATQTLPKKLRAFHDALRELEFSDFEALQLTGLLLHDLLSVPDPDQESPKADQKGGSR